MRVLYYSPGWPVSDFSNGIISYVAGVVPPLQQLGVETTILTDARGPNFAGDAIDLASSLRDHAFSGVHSIAERSLRKLAPDLASKWIFPWQLFRSGRAIANQHAIDLVEMEESFGVAASLAAGARAPLIVRLHGPIFLTATAAGRVEDARYLRQVRKEGELIAGAAAVSAPSLDVLRRVREHYGLELKDAVVIPNSGPPSLESNRWSWDKAETDHVLFVGRFDRHKGADVVIDAFAEVLRSRPNAKLSFVGADNEGLHDDQGKHWRVGQYVADRLGDQKDRVRILGRVPHEELAALRQSASVLVHPSRYENFSVAVLEACSQGVPIVASNVGGLPEHLDDEKSALLFPPCDASALAAKVCRILEDPQLAIRLGTAAFDDYGDRFSPERVAAQSLEFYQDVLKRAKRASSLGH
jgi:glycosyltransferase involved in cell wall biosynthesis